jgi:hypothetical protein
MSRQIHKALTHPLMFPKDDVGDQCRDIVSTSEGCGYASLHNIMRLAHPNLCDKVVETTIPYQGNVLSFAAPVRNMIQYIARGKLRNRLYTKYEALVMTLETLQARFRSQMKHKAGLLFEVGHNKVNDIPFKLAMSNLATTLTSWAKDLNLDVPGGTKGGRVNHLALLQGMDHGSEDNDVNYVGSYRQCNFCNISGHTADDCQLFINLLMASFFAKQHPNLIGATLKKHSTCMRIRPPGRGRPVNNLDMGPCTDVKDQIPDETTPGGGQVLHFDQDGLVCHLTDDSALYEYESDNESLHSCPFATPIVHIDEYELPFIPYIDDYLVAHVGDITLEGSSYENVVLAVESVNGTPTEQAVNWTSASNLPPTPTRSIIRKPQSM